MTAYSVYIEYLTHWYPLSSCAVGLQSLLGEDNKAYQHMNTEYDSIIAGVRKPLLTSFSKDITKQPMNQEPYLLAVRARRCDHELSGSLPSLYGSSND